MKSVVPLNPREEGGFAGGVGIVAEVVIAEEGIVAANLLAGGSSAPTGLTCNIGSGSPTTLGELVRTICAVAGSTIEPTLGPPRAGDIERSFADISLARQALGYHPRVVLQDGIADALGASRRAR